MFWDQYFLSKYFSLEMNLMGVDLLSDYEPCPLADFQAILIYTTLQIRNLKNMLFYLDLTKLLKTHTILFQDCLHHCENIFFNLPYYFTVYSLNFCQVLESLKRDIMQTYSDN